jgi:hypothetical protein
MKCDCCQEEKEKLLEIDEILVWCEECAAKIWRYRQAKTPFRHTLYNNEPNQENS